jgi:hypothetical protein
VATPAQVNPHGRGVSPYSSEVHSTLANGRDSQLLPLSVLSLRRVLVLFTAFVSQFLRQVYHILRRSMSDLLRCMELFYRLELLPGLDTIITGLAASRSQVMLQSRKDCIPVPRITVLSKGITSFAPLEVRHVY